MTAGPDMIPSDDEKEIVKDRETFEQTEEPRLAHVGTPNSLITNLDARERELQKQYQMLVMASSKVDTFIPQKSYTLSQKDAAAQLYDLVEQSHYLDLQLKNAQSRLKDAIDVVESAITICETPEIRADDESPNRLIFWYKEMEAYETGYKSILSKFNINDMIGLFGKRLCYDVKHNVEGFQEYLHFSSSDDDNNLEIKISYDGSDIVATSSIFLDGLNDLISNCLESQSPMPWLVAKIWQLFNDTIK